MDVPGVAVDCHHGDGAAVGNLAGHQDIVAGKGGDALGVDIAAGSYVVIVVAAGRGDDGQRGAEEDGG